MSLALTNVITNVQQQLATSNNQLNSNNNLITNLTSANSVLADEVKDLNTILSALQSLII